MSREYIAEILKRLREKSGLTANQVGEFLGKSGKTVNAWENNRGQPDAEMLIRLCDLYKVDNILAEFREENKLKNKITLSEHEENLILAYRSSNMKNAIDVLLGIPEEDNIKKDIIGE